MIKFAEHNTSLELEELKSEYTRSLLLIGLFTTILVVAIVNYLFAERSLAEYYGGFFTFIKIVGFILFFIVYQLANIRYLKRRMPSVRPPSVPATRQRVVMRYIRRAPEITRNSQSNSTHQHRSAKAHRGSHARARCLSIASCHRIKLRAGWVPLWSVTTLRSTSPFIH